MRGHKSIMFSLRNKKMSLNYPQYPLLSGALEISRFTGIIQKLKQEGHEALNRSLE